MTHDPSPFSPIFSINVSADPSSSGAREQRSGELASTLVALTRQLVEVQHRQNQLIEQLLHVNKQVLNSATQANTQRQNEINQWRNANPQLAQSCRCALETLSAVQTDFLQRMADEIEESKENLTESEYVFADFLDRYGPRMAHLNGVLQVLNHLAS